MFNPSDIPKFMPSLQTPHRALNDLANAVRDNSFGTTNGVNMEQGPMGTFTVPPPSNQLPVWQLPDQYWPPISVPVATYTMIADPFITLKPGYYFAEFQTQISGTAPDSCSLYLGQTIGSGSFVTMTTPLNWTAEVGVAFRRTLWILVYQSVAINLYSLGASTNPVSVPEVQTDYSAGVTRIIAQKLRDYP